MKKFLSIGLATFTVLAATFQAPLWAQAVGDDGNGTVIVQPGDGSETQPTGSSTTMERPRSVPQDFHPYGQCIVTTSSTCFVHDGSCALASGEFTCDEHLSAGTAIGMHNSFPGGSGYFEVTGDGFSMREFCERVGGSCEDKQKKSCPWDATQVSFRANIGSRIPR